ncbi:MAG: NADAR family protein [Bacteroidota bacterium]
MHYNLEWVKTQFEADERLKFLFFWGHHPNRNGQIGKSCFSQWWESDFQVDGIIYKTAEHWMMAEKARLFEDETTLSKILKSKSAAEAKKLGRRVRNFDEETWKTHRYDIVKRGNRHKFNQNKTLKDFLILTSNRILVEASPYDKIWGIGMKAGYEGIDNPYNWKGLNLLGFAIMEIRDEILD